MVLHVVLWLEVARQYGVHAISGVFAADASSQTSCLDDAGDNETDPTYGIRANNL